MCFSTMSQTTKNLTASTVNLANTMANQAKKVFGAADKTFNTISNAMTPIVSGGASQFGFSQGQFNALNANAVNAGATEQRNLRAQAATSGQPFNAAAIDQKVANDTATAQNQILQAGYTQGNQNFFKAAGDLGQAPGVYGVANEFNNSALKGLGQATTAQENRDAAGGGWKNLVKTGLAVAGDIGGSFIGDPGLGNQVMSVVGAAGGGGGGSNPTAGLGSAATSLFGKNGSAWGGTPDQWGSGNAGDFGEGGPTG